MPNQKGHLKGIILLICYKISSFRCNMLMPHLEISTSYKTQISYQLTKKRRDAFFLFLIWVGTRDQTQDHIFQEGAVSLSYISRPHTVFKRFSKS